MKLSLINKYAFAVTLIVFIVGCNSEKKDSTPETINSSSTNEKKTFDENGEVKIYTLPAPLQIATTLKTMAVPFEHGNLLSTKQRPYTWDLAKALNLGLYSIDLGYTSIYEQKQSSLNYVKVVSNLMQELGVTSSIQSAMVKRFEKNIENPDSLSKIILEGYASSQKYFQNNNREDVGLYILTGSYIEGLYLSLLNTHHLQKDMVENLVGQQKIFLDNIIELIQRIEIGNDETPLLPGILLDLQKEFSALEVEYKENEKTPIKCHITPQQIIALKDKCTEVRNKILKL